jgi:hypothetical protein
MRCPSGCFSEATAAQKDGWTVWAQSAHDKSAEYFVMRSKKKNLAGHSAAEVLYNRYMSDSIALVEHATATPRNMGCGSGKRITQ